MVEKGEEANDMGLQCSISILKKEKLEKDYLRRRERGEAYGGSDSSVKGKGVPGNDEATTIKLRSLGV
ncbi:unnamed protein product [Amaranthus hypochondriacus]